MSKNLGSYDDLNELHLDILKEIGNIGSGNAATALSTMLSRPVNIEVPTIEIVEYDELVRRLGGPEEMVVGIMLLLDDDFRGMMIFLLHQDFAHHTLNALLGEGLPGFAELDEMSFSLLQEIGNIMAASYINAIASLTDMKINISVPSLCVDMLGAILNVPAVHFAEVSDKVIYIKDQFDSDTDASPSHILLIPELDSLQNLVEKLGLDI